MFLDHPIYPSYTIWGTGRGGFPTFGGLFWFSLFHHNNDDDDDDQKKDDSHHYASYNARRGRIRGWKQAGQGEG